MTNSLIDECGLEAAANYALEAQGRGERFLKEIGVGQIIQAYLAALPKKERDFELFNMVNACRQHLLENKPVSAYVWLGNIEGHLKNRGDI